MGFNISGSNVNLNADAIWQSLDTRDGCADQKIQASIWNEFADITGGRHINNFITEKNALTSIQAYLNRASDEIKQKICEYFGWGNTTNELQDKITDADNLIEQIAADPSQAEITEKQNQENPDITIKKAILPDGRGILAKYDKNGEILSVWVSTDTSKHKNMSTQADFCEVGFDSKGVAASGDQYQAYNDANGYNSRSEFRITGGSYDFQRYKDLAEKIFGKQQTAEE